MKKEEHPLTLSDLISRELRRVLKGGIIFSISLYVGSAAYSVMHTKQTVEKLIVDHSIHLSQSASMSQNMLSLETEIHQFATALKETLLDEIEISITSNGKLLAHDGEINSHSVLKTHIQKEITLPSQETLTVSVDMSHDKNIISMGLSLLVVIAFMYLFLKVLDRRLGRSVRRLTDPLHETVSRIEEISKNLPESAHFMITTSNSNVWETNALNQSIQKLLKEIIELEARLTKTQFDRARLEIADHVAHNIRSPLASMEMTLSYLAEFPEERKVNLRHSIARIRDIASQLSLKKNDSPSDSNTADVHASTIELLPTLISDVVTEKRIQYRNKPEIEIDYHLTQSCHGAFAKINATDFKCVLSNLIDNSVEAIDEAGSVLVKIESLAEKIVISVHDTGRGIAPEILARLTERGFTVGKETGSGLGLYHARQSLEAWGGKLEILPSNGAGTIMKLLIPHAETPIEFLEQLELSLKSTVVVLDDDSSIHSLWKSRLDSEGLIFQGVRLLCFSNVIDFKEWFLNLSNHSDISSTQFLIDFNLQDPASTGLQVISDLGIESKSILVTSQFSDSAVQKRCQELQIKIIPKFLAGLLPIKVSIAGSLPSALPLTSHG
jgi:signal transduction histidine kinase